MIFRFPARAAVFGVLAALTAGVPAGVYNMVNGDGPGVGAAISAHPGIDLVSFTGSTRAGIEVSRAAAPTVKIYNTQSKAVSRSAVRKNQT